MLTLNETDRMLGMGFAKNIELIYAETHYHRQTL